MAGLTLKFGPHVIFLRSSSLLVAVCRRLNTKREPLMSDSMARAISRASVRSMEFAAIIPPVEIDFGGGTGVHEGKSISTEGGRGDRGV